MRRIWRYYTKNTSWTKRGVEVGPKRSDRGVFEELTLNPILKVGGTVQLSPAMVHKMSDLKWLASSFISVYYIYGPTWSNLIVISNKYIKIKSAYKGNVVTEIKLDHPEPLN